MPLRTDGDEHRRRRELLGMTTTECADALGYTLNHVSQIELGNRNAGPKYLRKAADLFECEIGDITKGELPRRRKLRAPTAQAKPERAAA